MLDYFLRSNKSNINQGEYTLVVEMQICDCM